MKRLASVLVVFAFTACTPSVTTTTGPAAAAVSTTRMATDVQTLSSDAFLGRGPATRGEELATNYIRDQLKAAGLEPGGPNGSWFQDVPLIMANIVGTPSLSVNVNGQTFPLTQGQQIAVRASMQNVTHVNIQNAPIVFLGYGVKAPERNWDDFKGEDVQGKVGLVLINDPDFETGQGDFGGKAMTYYGRWTYKYEEAARQGLAGMLVIHETAPASYGWATVKNSNTNTMFDIVRANPAEVHPLLEGWVQRDDAVRLFAASARTSTRSRAALRRASSSRSRSATRRSLRIIASNGKRSVEERARPPARNDPSERNDHRSAHTGITSASVHLTRAATRSTMVRSTTAPASPPCSSSRACSLQGRARSARSSLRSGRPRRKDCWVRSTMRAIPCIPSRRLSQGSTSTRSVADRTCARRARHRMRTERTRGSADKQCSRRKTA